MLNNQLEEEEIEHRDYLYKYFSLNKMDLFLRSFRQWAHRQSWYLLSIKAFSSGVNTMLLQWQCAISPTLHSNNWLQREQAFFSCIGIATIYYKKEY